MLNLRRSIYAVRKLNVSTFNTRNSGFQYAFKSTLAHSDGSDLLNDIADSGTSHGTMNGDKNMTNENDINLEVLAKKYMVEHEMVVTGRDVDSYLPIMSFDDATFNTIIMRTLDKQFQFDAPTPIQAQSWPIMNDNRDLISVARTGMGKTLGYLVPAFQKLMQPPSIDHVIEEEEEVREVNEDMVESIDMNNDRGSRRGKGNGNFFKRPDLQKLKTVRERSTKHKKDGFPRAVILAPTRELCNQILSTAMKLGRAANKRVLGLVGGANKGKQMNDLSRGCDMIVGTPGRVIDLIDTGYLDLSRNELFILDEGDQMLDMGFIDQIRHINQVMPASTAGRQTAFFSATWPDEVRVLAQTLSHNAIKIKIGSNLDSKLPVANSKITQIVLPVAPLDKKEILNTLLDDVCEIEGQRRSVAKTLIFCNTKAQVDDIVEDLMVDGYKVTALHGDIGQHKRDKRMNMFRKNKNGILIATDVAARGLDVHDIKMVVQYDIAQTIEAYVHRIGRTARGDMEGYAVAFFGPNDHKLCEDLVKVMENAGQEIPDDLMEIYEQQQRHSRRGNSQRNRGNWGARGGGGGRGGRNQGHSRRDRDGGGARGGGRYGRGDNRGGGVSFGSRYDRYAEGGWDDDYGDRRQGRGRSSRRRDRDDSW